MKKWIFALGCAALLAIACSDDSSSTVKASETSGEEVDNLSQQNESSSSVADSSESDEQDSVDVKKNRNDDDEETDSDSEKSSSSKKSSDKQKKSSSSSAKRTARSSSSSTKPGISIVGSSTPDSPIDIGVLQYLANEDKTMFVIRGGASIDQSDTTAEGKGADVFFTDMKFVLAKLDSDGNSTIIDKIQVTYEDFPDSATSINLSQLKTKVYLDEYNECGKFRLFALFYASDEADNPTKYVSIDSIEVAREMKYCPNGNGASSSSAVTESSSSSSKPSSEWRQTCLDVINDYRATENLEPISLAPEEKQTCTDKQAADDLADGKGHANFGDCDESAQNSGPNVNMRYYKSYDEIAKTYLKMMWEDEKALVTSGQRDPDNKADFQYIGHYLNMKGSYKTVSCGIAVSADGKTGWLNVDFYP